MRIEILKDGKVENTIIATEEEAERQFPGAWRVAEHQDPEPAPVSEPRNITVGAFYDRFGASKWAVLADTDPNVQAVISDASVRKYINLDNPDLPAALAIIQSAGHDIDPEAILGDPIRAEEHA